MMNAPERKCVDVTLKTLDGMADATDSQTEQALNAARHKAIASIATTHHRHWLWAMASAAVLVLVVGIYSVNRNGGEATALTEQLVADAELYQDMEFYTWLSEELESE